MRQGPAVFYILLFFFSSPFNECFRYVYHVSRIGSIRGQSRCDNTSIHQCFPSPAHLSLSCFVKFSVRVSVLFLFFFLRLLLSWEKISSLWIVMELLEGGSLQDLIKSSDNNLDEPTAQWILKEMLKVLWPYLLCIFVCGEHSPGICDLFQSPR